MAIAITAAGKSLMASLKMSGLNTSSEQCFAGFSFCAMPFIARCAYQAADMAHDAVGDYVKDYNERVSVLWNCARNLILKSFSSVTSLKMVGMF